MCICKIHHSALAPCVQHLSFQEAIVVSQKQYFSCSNKSVFEDSGVLEYDVLLGEWFLT